MKKLIIYTLFILGINTAVAQTIEKDPQPAVNPGIPARQEDKINTNATLLQNSGTGVIVNDNTEMANANDAKNLRPALEKDPSKKRPLLTFLHKHSFHPGEFFAKVPHM